MLDIINKFAKQLRRYRQKCCHTLIYFLSELEIIKTYMPYSDVFIIDYSTVQWKSSAARVELFHFIY